MTTPEIENGDYTFAANPVVSHVPNVAARLHALFAEFAAKDFTDARSKCPLADACELQLLRFYGDDGKPTAVAYECHVGDAACADLTAAATAHTASSDNKASNHVLALINREFDPLSQVKRP